MIHAPIGACVVFSRVGGRRHEVAALEHLAREDDRLVHVAVPPSNNFEIKFVKILPIKVLPNIGGLVLCYIEADFCR